MGLDQEVLMFRKEGDGRLKYKTTDHLHAMEN